MAMSLNNNFLPNSASAGPFPASYSAQNRRRAAAMSLLASATPVRASAMLARAARSAGRATHRSVEQSRHRAGSAGAAAPRPRLQANTSGAQVRAENVAWPLPGCRTAEPHPPSRSRAYRLPAVSDGVLTELLRKAEGRRYDVTFPYPTGQTHFSLLGGQDYTVPGMFTANVADDQSPVVPVAPMPGPPFGTTRLPHRP